MVIIQWIFTKHCLVEQKRRLAHQPRAAAEAIHWNDVKLVLSGHTHAGQILPLMLPIYIYNPFFAGLYEPLPRTYVYVSAGTHCYMLP